MRVSAIAALLFALPLSIAAAAQQPARPSFAQPNLSPDGKEIAFASGGDIWTVPSTGGDARLLISDPAEESRPLFSPDGTRLAFNSTRTGANDIYVLTLATGTLQRITFSDSAASLDAWSKDSQWLYFTSTANDVAGQGDIFRVHATGGTPLEVSRERYMNEFESTPSPDGQQIAFVAKGISSGQWWRNGHAHIDETELWLKPIASPAGYRLLLAADSKHAWPMFAADGKSIYFMSDRSLAGQPDRSQAGKPSVENIWQADTSTAALHPLTSFKSGRVLWPSLSADGRTILFERHFEIWSLDTRTGKSSPIPIALRGVPSTPGITHTALTGWSGLALSPDGKKIAVAAHGDIFAASAKDGGEPQRLTRTDSPNPTRSGPPTPPSSSISPSATAAPASTSTTSLPTRSAPSPTASSSMARPSGRPTANPSPSSATAKSSTSSPSQA